MVSGLAIDLVDPACGVYPAPAAGAGSAHHGLQRIRQGREVQVDPIKTMLKAPGTLRLKPKHDEPPSNFAFKFNLRRYIKVVTRHPRVFAPVNHIWNVLRLYAEPAVRRYRLN